MTEVCGRLPPLVLFSTLEPGDIEVYSSTLPGLIGAGISRRHGEKVKRTLIALLLLVWACEHNAARDGTVPDGTEANHELDRLELPSSVTGDNLATALRQLRAAPLQAPGRNDLRGLIVQHLRPEFENALRRGAHDEAWELFTSAANLYETEELRPGEVEPSIGEMAESLLDIFEPRGDETRVLGALLMLTLTSSDPEPWAARYNEVARWSEEVRRALPSETERVIGLVRVYEGVTDIVALPDPVDRLSALYLERHRLLQGAFGGMLGLQALMTPRGRGELQSLLAARGRSVADIVSLHLRAGRPDDVRRVIAPLDPLSGRDRELVQATRDLRSERRRSRSLTFLAANLGRDDPDIALMLCHHGRRAFPRDPIFAQCLAEVYRQMGDATGALEYYEGTLEIAPTAENFERALVYVAHQMERELTEDNTRRAREIHAHAEGILRAFTEHFPNRRAPVEAHHLAYLIGVGEYNAGNIDQAVERFEASNEARATRAAYVQLGLITERRGQADDAIRHYRAALDLRPEGQTEDPLSRAIVLDHLADAYALAGNAERALTLHGEALEMLQVAQGEAPPQRLPDIGIERGLILFDMGRDEDGRRELQQALEAAPQRRSSYARLLSFYVGHDMLEPALEVFRLAFNHSDLDHTWKTYYAMWIIGLQRRLDQTPDATAVAFLETIEGDEWIEQLGRFYAGDLPYEQVLNGAASQGQRAEIYFYEAVLQIARGERARGLELLQQVIETDMLGYYEFEFARRLQRTLSASPAPDRSAATP